MPSSYTSLNRLEKQAAGENSNTWGANLNTNTIDMADEAMDGVTAFTLSGSKTLSTANGATDESRARVLHATSGTGGTVTIPNVKKNYQVINDCSGDITFTTGSGTTAVVKASTVGLVVSLGSNVVHAVSIADLPIAVASGGTGATTAAAARAALGLTRGVQLGFSGRPTVSQIVPAIAPYAFTITSANCSASAEVAATAQTIFTLKEAGVSIGTVTFAAAATTGTFNFTDTSIASKARITAHAPASRDATLSDVAILILE